MNKWFEWVNTVLNFLPAPVRDALLQELDRRGRKLVVQKVPALYGRELAESIDRFVVNVVRTVPVEHAGEVVDAYVKTVRGNASEFGEAITAYAPKQLAVELAKKAHGEDSNEVAVARAERKSVLMTLKREVREVLESAVKE